MDLVPQTLLNRLLQGLGYRPTATYALHPFSSSGTTHQQFTLWVEDEQVFLKYGTAGQNGWEGLARVREEVEQWAQVKNWLPTARFLGEASDLTDGRYLVAWSFVSPPDRFRPVEDDRRALEALIVGLAATAPPATVRPYPIRQTVHRLKELTARNEAQGDILRNLWSESTIRAFEAAPHQWLHGNPHRGNLLWDEHGMPLFVGWAYACLGPLEWDFACLAVSTHADKDLIEKWTTAYGLNPALLKASLALRGALRLE